MVGSKYMGLNLKFSSFNFSNCFLNFNGLIHGAPMYSKGLLDKEIIEILTRSKDVGKIIHKTTGQDKYLKTLPFLPICKKCKRIYTNTAYHFDPKTKKIHYKCDQEFVGKNSNTGKEILVKGCGHQGEAGIRDGKVSWKVEFAARWKALKIRGTPIKRAQHNTGA